ncbi:putative arginyl-tRNA--protein transferase 1 isoform X3 [Penaeus vannamei]|uniref:Putative arginyl-tRNA--protein transferase 1 isoform X3 n=1 Tax=Penaeus vannamei TaxID=6689 RepID=A0A3R7M1L2_PENVA|nr:putative arginyl-tRNA--protein transferase 1 isoform X3 [Penaeus vannamei]
MAEEKDNSYTILEYMRDHSGYKCGYCKSQNTNFSHGMWAHQITVGDYQDLIDRGWRRSGKYCYKPTMDKTCCPMYTIKCDAVELKLSKTQKKVLKRMHRYLSHGEIKKGSGPDSTFDNESSEDLGGNQEFIKPQYDTKEDLSGVSLQMPCEDAAKKPLPVHSLPLSAAVSRRAASTRTPPGRCGTIHLDQPPSPCGRLGHARPVRQGTRIGADKASFEIHTTVGAAVRGASARGHSGGINHSGTG